LFFCNSNGRDARVYVPFLQRPCTIVLAEEGQTEVIMGDVTLVSGAIDPHALAVFGLLLQGTTHQINTLIPIFLILGPDRVPELLRISFIRPYGGCERHQTDDGRHRHR